MIVLSFNTFRTETMTGSKVVFIISASAFTLFANARQIQANIEEDKTAQINQTSYQQENIFQIVDDNFISNNICICILTFWWLLLRHQSLLWQVEPDSREGPRGLDDPLQQAGELHHHQHPGPGQTLLDQWQRPWVPDLLVRDILAYWPQRPGGPVCGICLISWQPSLFWYCQ